MHSCAHVANVALKPCGTASTFMRRNVAVSVMSDRGIFLVLGNTKSVLAKVGSALSSLRAGVLRGILCSRSAFIRSAGMRQTACSRSISDHSAPRASPDLQAV